jgi:hypothetical protein
MNKSSVTDKELTMVEGSIRRQFGKQDFDGDTVLPMLEGFQLRSNPLVCHGLNRTLTWLHGPDGRWTGDERLRATWQDDVCTLECDGRSWLVSLKIGEQGNRVVELARISENGETFRLASGEERNGKGITWRALKLGTDTEGDTTFDGSIDGEGVLGAFDEFCDFMDAVKPSIPQAILDITAGTVWITKVPGFLDAREIIQLDGGLPGRLCRALDYTAQVLGARAGLLSVIDRYEALANGLADLGAVWGKNILQYNDGDARCCTISMGEGSVALYSEHTAGGFDERGYIAVFDRGSDGRVTSVSGHLLDGDDEDDEAIVASVVDRSAAPAFRFDVATQKVEIAEGRKAHYAVRMMFLQFAYDEEYALEGGELEPAKRSAATPSMGP